jgi:hypothetical protein
MTAVSVLLLTLSLSVATYGVALLSDAVSERRRARRHAMWLASFYERDR